MASPKTIFRPRQSPSFFDDRQADIRTIHDKDRIVARVGLAVQRFQLDLNDPERLVPILSLSGANGTAETRAIGLPVRPPIGVSTPLLI